MKGSRGKVNNILALLAFLVCLSGAALPVRAAVQTEDMDRGTETTVQADTFQAQEDAAQTDTSQEQEGGGNAAGAVGGTAVLVGAGVYTCMRTRWKENKRQEKYEYFENHTKTGTERQEERDAKNRI